MADDKTIKFSIATNELELSKTLTAIRSITNEFNKLVQTFNQFAGKSGGAIGGILGGASNRASAPGSSSAQGVRNVGGSGIGKIGGILTEGLIADKNLFKTIAEGSKDAFKVMQDSLTNSVRIQKNEIKSLKQEIDGLTVSYRKVSGIGGATTLPGGIGGAATIPGGGSGISGAAITSGFSTPGGGGGGGFATTPGFLRPSGSGGGGSGFFGGMMSPFSFGGQAGAGFAIGNAIGSAVLGAVKDTLKQVGTSAAANSGFAMQAPTTLASQQAAQFGQMGAVGEELRGGNVAKNFFMMRALTGSTMKGLNTSNVMIARNAAMRSNSGMNPLSAGDWYNRAVQGIAQNGFNNGPIESRMLETMSPGMNMTPNEIALMKEQFARDPQRLQELMDETGRQIQQSPRLANMINESYQGAQGRLNLEAQLGAGGYTRTLARDRNGNTIVSPETGRLINESALTQATRSAAKLSIDVNQYAGFRQQMAQSAGRGFMGFAGAIAGPTIGGFSNAAQTFGLGAQFGGGAQGGMALLNAAQRGMGAGGVDVTAGNQIAGLVGSGMQSGNFRGDAVSAMQGLMSAGFTGGPGSDMLQARVLQAGMSGFGTIASGSLDPLQQGINMVAANRAAPGMQQYTKNQLMMLEPTQLINIARSGKVDPVLASAGVTPGMVKQYLKEQTSFALTRFNPAQGGNTRMAREVSSFLKAGSVDNYLRGMPKQQRRESLDILGNAMRLSTGGALTLDQAAGYLTGSATGDKGLFPTLKGGGAYNAAADALAKSNLKSQADIFADKEVFRAQNQGKAALAGQTAGQNADMLDTLSGDLVSGAKSFSEALNLLTNAVMNNLKRIDPTGYANQMKKNKEQVSKLNANTKDTSQ